jgi:hypothetical protein
MVHRNVILCLVSVLVHIESVMPLEKEMTISIDPRREECFFQPVKLGQVIDVEYQVSAFRLYPYIFTGYRVIE